MARTHSRGAHAGKPAPLLGTLRPGHASDTGSPPGPPGPSRSGPRPRAPRLASLRQGRLRVPRPRLVAACVAAALLLTGIALGWASPEPSVEPTVQTFLLDWEQGRYQAASELTTGTPAGVTTALDNAYQQLGAVGVTLGMAAVTQDGDSAAATFNASVDLGDGGPPWRYQNSFRLRRAGGSWKVVWAPSVIAPRLRPGLRLAVLETMPPRAQILDDTGQPLSPLSAVVSVGVIPGHVARPGQTAAGLAAVTGLPASQILPWITQAPAGQFDELVQYAPAQYSQLAAKLSAVPGLVVKQQQTRLFASIAPAVTGPVGGEASPLLQQEGVPYRPGTTVGLSGLEQTFQHSLVGSPTTEVVEQNASGTVTAVLRKWPGRTGSSIATTIDAPVQRAADAAVAAAPGSAAIVAVSASTGKILAVASRQAGGMPAVSPLDGHYPAGQAFTIVSSTALLKGGFNPATPIPCIASNEVGGRNFTNDPPESGLGPQPPFSTDFASACGTAFAGLSLQLNAKSLTSAVSGYGLGARWQLPLSSFSGSMRTPKGQAELAEDTIGTGSVQVSPIDLALAAGAVDSGVWHPPSVITSASDPGLSPRAAFSSQVLSSLRGLMRLSVTSGAGKAANVPGQPPVYGQVGNAPMRTGGQHAAWFVGYQGTVAFAVLQLSSSAASSAAPLAGGFLTQLHAKA